MKMPNRIVELKGYRDGLHLIIDPKLSITQMESAIVKRLANIGNSLSGKEINLDIGDRDLKDDELERLKRLLNDQYKLQIKKVNSNSQQTSQLEDILEIRGAPATHQQKEFWMEDEIQFDVKPETTRLVRHTLRSGQREQFLEGNIVVVGDVNPGAEVVALGDVVVLGALRGMAHAGALGDSSAVIIALDLEPTQLRIGKFINRPPSNNIESDKKTPEIAEVENNIIKVSPYKKLGLLSVFR